MLSFRYYDPEERIDRVWYDSTNLLYSECDDNVDDYKTLRITFKNGQTYLYEKVDVNDYVLFAHGGTDASNGKAFWKVIRPKYEGKKIGEKTEKEILDLLEYYTEKKKTMLEQKNAGGETDPN